LAFVPLSIEQVGEPAHTAHIGLASGSLQANCPDFNAENQWSLNSPDPSYTTFGSDVEGLSKDQPTNLSQSPNSRKQWSLWVISGTACYIAGTAEW